MLCMDMVMNPHGGSRDGVVRAIAIGGGDLDACIRAVEWDIGTAAFMLLRVLRSL